MKAISLCLATLLTMLSGMAFSAVTVAEDEAVIFYAHDVLGSPIAVSDEQGRVLWYENTEPYGKSLNRYSPDGTGLLDNGAEQTLSRVGYTGHQSDTATGLIYMKARYYDPHIGRFYSSDPVGFYDTGDTRYLNRYAYVANNPMKYTDPTGMVIEIEITGDCTDYDSCDDNDNQGDDKVGIGFDWSVFHSDSDNDGRSLPFTQAGHEAAEYWADRVVNSEIYEDPIARAGLALSSLWSSDRAALITTTALTLGRGSDKLRFAMGPRSNWIRFGRSYSRAAQQRTRFSVKWGASPARGGRYVNQIPNATARAINQWLRGLRIPGRGRSTADPGHLHIRF